MEYFATSKPGLQADLQATGFIEQHLSLPKPGSRDDRESLFKYEFKPKVCFAQDWLYDQVQNVACGNTVSAPIPKQMDIIRHQYVHFHVPGIIGRQDINFTHEYPFLVPSNQCGPNHPNCVPHQERLVRDFETDSTLGLEVDTVPQYHINTLAGDVLNARATLQDAMHELAVLPEGGNAFQLLDTIAVQQVWYDTLQTVYANVTGGSNAIGSLTMRPFAHWVQGVGYRLIEKLFYDVGQQTLETIDYRYIHAIDELHRGVGKRQTFQVGMHSDRESLIRHSLYDQELYVSLPLWYTYFIGISNMIVSQQLTDMRFRVQLADLRNLIVCSDPLTKPFLSEDDQTNWAYESKDVQEHDRQATTTEVARDSISMAMLYNAYYLEEAERDLHLHRAAHSHERNAENQVITKCQRNTFESHSDKTSKWAVETQETVFEVIVTAQLESNRISNNWFNLSRIGPDVGGTGATTHRVDQNTGAVTFGEYPHEIRHTTPDADIITAIEVYQNNQLRFSGPAHMFRTVVPGEVHTNIPDLYAGHYIYCISWAVFPEDISTYSGGVNTTRISSLDIVLTYHERAIRERKTIELNFRTWGLYTMFSNVGGHVFSG